jgi:hypothetical protein
MISKSLNCLAPQRHIPRMSNNEATRQIPKLMLLTAAVLGSVCLPQSMRAEQLKKETDEAFERYVRTREARMDQELAGGEVFLWIDALPQPSRDQAFADLKKGQIMIHRSQGNDSTATPSIRGGLIHDWSGIVFVPGVSMSQAIALLQDYDHGAEYYSPEVVKSRLLKRSGNDFHVFLRLKQVHIVTVVLDTEYNVHYTFLDPARAISRSYSTRIAEIENAGEAHEHDRPVGNDHGFLWRLNSYWRFYQANGGVYVQCNAISLTRDVPTGLGWLVGPFIENIPRDSLRFTLDATRTALADNFTNTSVSLQTKEKQKQPQGGFSPGNVSERRATR